MKTGESRREGVGKGGGAGRGPIGLKSTIHRETGPQKKRIKKWNAMAQISTDIATYRLSLTRGRFSAKTFVSWKKYKKYYKIVEICNMTRGLKKVFW